MDIRGYAELLKDHPSLGRVFVKDPELGITYRALTAKLNKIVYFVDNETITIFGFAIRRNSEDV